MCGIAGIFGRPEAALLERMTRRLAHRGPDGQGSVIVGSAGLGSTRLSLVDFAGGAQPMSGERGLTLVYNGELYNGASLRQELKREGAAFHGHGDTELVLRALELRGPGGVEGFEGMFAYAASDGERLWLARDVFGVKPLFYALVDGGRRLLFASELKSLLEDPTLPRTLDRAALVEWATFGYALGERTIFAAIRQVPPGGSLEVTRGPDGVLALHPGRHGAPRRVSLPEGDEALCEWLIELLTASVRGQRVADHPVGSFLSGGVDSAVMTALMAREGAGPLHTFSVADDRGSEDLAMGRRLADCLGTAHHELVLDPESLLEELPRTICALETPAAPSLIDAAAPSIRRHVKAALCGDGADELFAGYPVHVEPGPWLRSCLERYNRVVRTGQARVSECEGTKRALQSMASAGAPGLREAVYRFFLESQLTEAHLVVWDRGAMASGLEVRVPYLDRAVRDLALALPWERRIRGNIGKVLLREVARRVLPESLATGIIERSKLAAPSAVQATSEALSRAARELVPAEPEGHAPLGAFCASPRQQLLLDLFVLLFVGRGGVPPEALRWRELYTTHREELEAARAVAAG